MNSVKMYISLLKNLVYTSAPLTRCAVRILRIFGAWLINFLRTWGEQRTPGASGSLCVHAKNRQILVRNKQYANHSRMAQCRFAVPSIHTHIWFTNCSRAVRESFGVLVYTRLKDQVASTNGWFHQIVVNLRLN